jgi:hypothetical protein
MSPARHAELVREIEADRLAGGSRSWHRSRPAVRLNPPAGNYVDAVQVGKLLFLAGNTMGPKPKFRGQVSKDVTVQEGYESARQVGLLMLAKYATHWAASIV